MDSHRKGTSKNGTMVNSELMAFLDGNSELFEWLQNELQRCLKMTEARVDWPSLQNVLDCVWAVIKSEICKKC